MMTKRIVIAVPHRGNQPDITADLAKWLVTFKKLKGYKHTQGFFKGQPVDNVRNQIVKTFLGMDDSEWLVMVDSDCVPPINALEMTQHGKKIVSGVCFSAQNGVTFPLIQIEREDSKFGMMSEDELKERSINDRLIHVDGIGFGCVAVHREVLEKMSEPWFRFDYLPNSSEIKCSEDYYFSKKARENGYEIYVDRNVMVGHIKAWDCMHINRTLYNVSCYNPKQKMVFNKVEAATSDVKPNLFDDDERREFI